LKIGPHLLKLLSNIGLYLVSFSRLNEMLIENCDFSYPLYITPLGKKFVNIFVLFSSQLSQMVGYNVMQNIAEEFNTLE